MVDGKRWQPGNILEMIFWKEKSNRCLRKKLTHNITYAPFQNVRSILEELNIALTPDKEHKKVFPNVNFVEFRMARTLRITWLEPNYQNVRRVEDLNYVGKKLAWSVILQVLPRLLLQKHARKLFKFRETT